MTMLQNISTAEGILNGALPSFIILMIGWVLTRFLKHRTAPLRSGVAFMIMLVLLILPILTLSASALGFKPIQTILTLDLGPAPIRVDGNSVSSAPETDRIPIDNSIGSPHFTTTIFNTIFGPGPFVIKALNLFGVIWGLGLALFFIRFIYGIFSLGKLKNNIFEVSNDRISRILSEAEPAFQKTLKIKIFASPEISSPIVLGFFDPRILIPSDLIENIQDKELRVVLLHEMSHIFHRDHITVVFQRIFIMLNWWNPLAYALSGDFSRTREEISDNHVLKQNDRREYAECLVNLAEKTSHSMHLMVPAISISPHINLTDRIKSILSKERNMETQLKKSTLGVIILVSILLIGMGTGYRLTFAASNHDVLTEIVTPDGVTTHDVLQESKKQKEAEPKPVRAIGDIKAPKLLKMVDPIYPKEARQEGIEGVVILEATSDKYGRVIEAKILRSIPELDQAAIDAVKQWVYEPFLLDEKPTGVIFTVTVRFKLKSAKDKKKEPGATEGTVGGVVGGVAGKKPARAGGTVRAIGDIQPPQLIKRVDPIYPKEARQEGIEGVVILEATTGIYGRVQEASILRSIPELDQAAIDAVMQWVYKPFLLDGKPKGVTFTVTVRFKLKDKKECPES